MVRITTGVLDKNLPIFALIIRKITGNFYQKRTSASSFKDLCLHWGVILATETALSSHWGGHTKQGAA